MRKGRSKISIRLIARTTVLLLLSYIILWKWHPFFLWHFFVRHKRNYIYCLILLYKLAKLGHGLKGMFSCWIADKVRNLGPERGPDRMGHQAIHEHDTEAKIYGRLI